MATANLLELSPLQANRRYDVSILWGSYKLGLKVPMIRLTDLSLHKQFQSFSLSVAAETTKHKRAFDSRMQALGYALLDYAKFLNATGRTWIDANDKLLASYRDYALDSIKKSKSSRNESTAKRSANDKLRIIYKLYAWAFAGTDIQTPTIGAGTDDCISSTLLLYNANPNEWNSHPRKLYPQCFHDAGDGSSNMSGQHWASNTELADIEEYFRSACTERVAERNILFMRIIDQMGLRRESVNSLMISQFSDDAINKSIEANMTAHAIQPKKQKFNGLNFFDAPFALAWEINRYIKSQRGENIFEKIKNKKSLSSLPIFTSTSSNHGLADKTWTSIFSKAFKLVGAPKGAGCHSIRRKFAEDWFRKEIQRCIDQNLPISYSDIVAGLAKVLGHESKLSQEAYRRANSMTRVNTPLDVLTEQNRELNVQVMNQAARLHGKDEEISRLRALVESSGTKPTKKSSPRTTRAIRYAV